MLSVDVVNGAVELSRRNSCTQVNGDMEEAVEERQLNGEWREWIDEWVDGLAGEWMEGGMNRKMVHA